MAKSTIKIDLTDIEGYYDAYRFSAAKAKTTALAVARQWALQTEGMYKSSVPYGNGFHSVKRMRKYKAGDEGYDGHAYSDTRETSTGFHVEVGHQCFIARFLEAGTKAHETYPGKTVRGIKGSKALDKVMKSRKPILEQNLSKAFTELIGRRKI